MALKVKYQGPLVLDANGNSIINKRGNLLRRPGRPALVQWKGLTPDQVLANHLLRGPQRHTLLKGGSRSGKTFLLCRAVIMRALKAPNGRHAIFRLRYNAAKTSLWLDTIPKVIKCCFPEIKFIWNNSDLFLTCPNGSEVWIGGLDDKERVEKLLGREYATLYFNECSQIPYASITLALTRLAQRIDGLVNRAYYDLNPTTTGHWTSRIFIQKRRVENFEKIPDPENYASMTLNPEGNADNIDPAALAELRNLPDRLRKRFYSGEYVSEIPGQLWNVDMLEQCRVDETLLPSFKRVVVAIDPSGARGAMDIKSDEIGIVVCAMGSDDRGYVLEDLTGLYSPEQWAKIAVTAFDRHHADRILGERNYGGDMVRAVIHGHRRNAPFKEVTASRGKVVRAEPVAALYERERIRHVGTFPVMEEQLTNFLTSGYTGEGSPNNADAMIWGMTDLFNLHQSLAGFFEIISVEKGGGDSSMERSSSYRMPSNVGTKWGQN